MRIPAVLGLLVLVACGGGSQADEDGLVEVFLVPSIASGAAAQAFWGSGNDHIEILDVYGGEDRLALLEHELWHILAEMHGHPNPIGCVSTTNALDNEPALTHPCAEEVEQVRAAGKRIRLRFREDLGTALQAALFWNGALQEGVWVQVVND